MFTQCSTRYKSKCGEIRHEDPSGMDSRYPAILRFSKGLPERDHFDSRKSGTAKRDHAPKNCENVTSSFGYVGTIPSHKSNPSGALSRMLNGND